MLASVLVSLGRRFSYALAGWLPYLAFSSYLPSISRPYDICTRSVSTAASMQFLLQKYEMFIYHK